MGNISDTSLCVPRILLKDATCSCHSTEQEGGVTEREEYCTTLVESFEKRAECPDTIAFVYEVFEMEEVEVPVTKKNASDEEGRNSGPHLIKMTITTTLSTS